MVDKFSALRVLLRDFFSKRTLQIVCSGFVAGLFVHAIFACYEWLIDSRFL